MRTDSWSDTAFMSPQALSNSQARAKHFAGLAQQALIAEAELTPKPGLVDRRGSGVHSDLSLAILRHSAFAIEPYFSAMASIPPGTAPSQPLREWLALVGREAEHAMFKATGGSNSHKGAIWTLGLLLSAAAMGDRDELDGRTIATSASKIASFEDRALPRLVSHGDVVAKRYGVMGARGEALCGFPHVINVGLPMLRLRRAIGATESVARLDALLSIMSRLDDTCLLYRGGKEGLMAAKGGAAAVESVGGNGTPIGRLRLKHLDQQLLTLGISPGGSGDLLAATLFLDALERGENEVKADRDDSEGTYGAD
jgi:triphosphoribosyl-dephospho-CoA synthase